MAWRESVRQFMPCASPIHDAGLGDRCMVRDARESVPRCGFSTPKCRMRTRTHESVTN